MTRIPNIDASSPRFFTDEQHAAVDAAMARIIPSGDGPGAKEAGAVDFVDRYLSGIEFVYAAPDGDGFENIVGRRRAAWLSRIQLLREKYVEGIAQLDELGKLRFDCPFVELTADQQDDILRLLERGVGVQDLADIDGDRRPADIDGDRRPADLEMQMSRQDEEFDFFPLLVAHTRQGFYSDPVYGGNRDRVGWDWIGFPGPTSMADVHDGTYDTLPWFADDLAHPEEEGDGKGR
jgi:gluconate 2-dehydrogenase gamma chain